ncbi:Uu.00g110950.m01.CDS01 [Anthostomella pinea]|uniref:Uu.00g110950.m01.CDS01 n=1 Tax=Anthostomella pinea TaxID=933095 RepID=A0AAI8VF29_9PEZI|nr:Uu.00g110950.m01.CDS01 [Anthostomella pinea]
MSPRDFKCSNPPAKEERQQELPHREEGTFREISQDCVDGDDDGDKKEEPLNEEVMAVST